MNSRLALLKFGALAFVFAACSSSPTTPTPTPTPSATPAPTQTSATPAAPTATVTPTPSVSADVSTAVFPTGPGAAQFTDPVAVARAFATSYADFVEPVVGPFQRGDARSGEVSIRPSATGPVTTVMVRQLGSDGHWWVLGASTAAITLRTPVWFARISSPVTLTGTSSAFEGTVQTQVLEDGNGAPLGQGFVTGGSTGPGPFDGTLSFAKPTQQYGALMLYTTSQEGAPVGHTREVTVIRVRFTS